MSLTRAEAEEIKRLALFWVLSDRNIMPGLDAKNLQQLKKIVRDNEQALDNYLEGLIDAKPRQSAMDG